MATELDVAARLQTPTGWVELEDEANGYRLHEDAFGQASVTHRMATAEGDWMEGTFAHRSVRGNTQELVAVWVHGNAPYEFRTRLDRILAGFSQLSYQLVVRFGDLQETWTCPMPADYQVVTEKAFRFATTGYVRATVNRLPTIQVEQVTP